MVGKVAAVLSDVDGDTHVAVTLVDDPAAELHDWYGRYLYFAPDELEPAAGERRTGTPEGEHHEDAGNVERDPDRVLTAVAVDWWAAFDSGYQQISEDASDVRRTV